MDDETAARVVVRQAASGGPAASPAFSGAEFG